MYELENEATQRNSSDIQKCTVKICICWRACRCKMHVTSNMSCPTAASCLRPNTHSHTHTQDMAEVFCMLWDFRDSAQQCVEAPPPHWRKT